MSHELDELLKCAVCHELIIEPVTLICQHTFCIDCVKALDINRCPSCRMSVIVPPMINNLMSDLIKITLGDRYDGILEERNANKKRETEREEIKREIERRIFHDIANMAMDQNPIEPRRGGVKQQHIQRIFDLPHTISEAARH